MKPKKALISTLRFRLLILLFFIMFSLRAQPFLDINLNIGDPTPPLKIKEWVKGEAVQRFDIDKIYVLEFWATWCIPCMVSMSHLSRLVPKYQDSVTFMAVDVYEKGEVPVEKIRQLVDSMGNRMDFRVGIEEDRFMAKNWLDTSGARGIPTTFIINNGKIDWIGHPKYLDSVLTKILNKSWSPEFARLKRNHQQYLKYLEYTGSQELTKRISRYAINIAGNTYERMQITPDSVLMVINEMVKHIPDLKYTPVFVAFTFQALLETDMQKAYNFGRETMNVPAWYDDPPYSVLIQTIEDNAEKLQLPEVIYRLGAECYQALINRNPYPEYGDIPGQYKKMANLYRLAGDFEKASEAEQAIISLPKPRKSP